MACALTAVSALRSHAWVFKEQLVPSYATAISVNCWSANCQDRPNIFCASCASLL